MSVTLITNVGDLKLEIYCEECPKTAENFLALCASHYYDGCLFHRNIPKFMVQTGDPTNTGKGGESIWHEEFEDEFNPSLRHYTRGIVSMANNGPDSNGSQFFITYAKQPHLDDKYTVFGRIIDGMDTLDTLERMPLGSNNRPLHDIYIKSVKIHANPIADKQ